MVKSSAPVNYQTVKLAAGKHDQPSDGVCVMELASMLGGEPFTDHPRSVCPVIAAFMRAYNDAVDDGRRQDLYRLASLAVGTRDSWVIEQMRGQRCREWAEEVWNARPWALRLFGRRAAGLDGDLKAQGVARSAVAAIGRHTDHTHALAIALVEELCAMSSQTSSVGPGARRRPAAVLPA